MFIDRVTPQVLQDLGEAYLIPDADCLYIISDRAAWLLCLTSYDLCLPVELVNLIHAYTDEPGHRYLQWDLFCADVDTARQQYFPAHAKAAKTLMPSRHPKGLDAQSVRNNISEIGWALSDRAIDVTAAFQAGEAHSVYPTSPRTGQFARGDVRASTYVFQRQSRVIAVDGDYFRGFTTLGFSLACTSQRQATGRYPLLSAVCVEESGAYLFGFLPPLEKSEVLLAPDGRPIYEDAAKVSWCSVDEAVEIIRADTQILSPRRHDLSAIQMDIAERLNVAETRSYHQDLQPTTLFAVGVLRWNGVPEEDILELLEGQREASYEAGYHQAVKEVLDATQNLLTNPPVSWSLGAGRTALTTFLDVLDVLQQLGIEADSTPAEELRGILDAYDKERG